MAHIHLDSRIRIVNLSLGGTHELGLFLGGLESAVTVLGRGIDELEVDGLVVRAAGTGDKRLSHGDGTLLAAGNASLKHDPILVDHTIVGETTKRGDRLLGQIVLSGGTVGVALLANTQDTLVDVGSVVVAHLTSASTGNAHAGRVPGTNTGHLAQTTVGLSGQTSHTPTRHNTVVTLTLGDGADINDLTLSKDAGDGDFLFEKLLTEVDLVSDRATVDLDLEKISNLAAQLNLADLGVAKSTDNSAVVYDALKLRFNILRLLGGTLGVLGEGLSLGSVPVLVEATLDLLGKMVSPDGGQSAQTGGGLDIADKTDNDDRRSLKNGDGLDSLLLV